MMAETLLTSSTFQGQYNSSHQHQIRNDSSYISIVKWSRPSPGMSKINFDAALFPTKGTVGFGVVMHNDVGGFIIAKNGYLKCSQDPTLIEVLACHEVVSWIKANNFHDIILETC